jgi:hypothetical protein
MITETVFPITKKDLLELGRSDISAVDISKIQERILTSGFPTEDCPLSEVPTCRLVNEIVRRQGVSEIVIPVQGKVEICAEDMTRKFQRKFPDGREYLSNCFYDEISEGPARVLLVID